MVRKPVTNKGFITYFHFFMYVVYYVIFNEKLPRVIPLMQESLQLSKDTNTGE